MIGATETELREKEKEAELEATTILRARLKKELALVKLNADVILGMIDIVDGRFYQNPDPKETVRRISASFPVEFSDAARELQASIVRFMNTAGLYR